MKTFGVRFKELRKSKKLTQEELAEQFNKQFNTTFNKSTISQYENDKRKPEVGILENWADFFDVSIDYLLCRTNEQQVKKERFQGVNTIAAHRLGNIEQLSDEGLEELDNYIELLKLKYKK